MIQLAYSLNSMLATVLFIIVQVEYHKEFEKEKGHFTVVSDDPETLRIKKNTENISTVKYAGASAEMRLGTSDRGAQEGG